MATPGAPAAEATTVTTVSSADDAPCPKCGRATPVTVSFCTFCHARLRYACPACQHLQADGKKCEACGVDFVEFETKKMQLAAERARITTRRSHATTAILVGAVALVLAVGTWWGVSALSGGAAREPRRAIAVSGAAPQPAPTAGTEAQLQADAVHLLQGLRGQVQAGTNYLEYNRATFEVDKAVARYVSAPQGDTQFKSDTRETMDLYVLAARAWNAGVRLKAGDRDGAAAALVPLSRDPALDLCPAAKDARDTATSDGTVPLDIMQGVGVVSAVPAIFDCAQRRLADLEGRLPAR